MSTLYLAADPRSLADRLADDLDRDAKHGDFFTPATIVVPNRYLKKWLRLHLARRRDVAINLKFQALEEALWELLQESTGQAPPDTIDDNVYRLMVLSVVLEESDPDLAPLRRYLQIDGPNLSRLSCRRAWYLADRLGLRLQDYEYHRQDALIQPWLAGRLGLANPSEFQRMMERAQRAVFRHITREPDGKRAVLNRLLGTTYKTFPQYAMECMEPTARAGEPPLPRQRIIHFFGFTQVSELHARTIAWLGQHFDIRFHHLNVASGRYSGDLQATVQELREPSAADAGDRVPELLRLWGRAAAESLLLLAPLATQGFAVEPLPALVQAKAPASVLRRLREQLLDLKTTKTRLPQDRSLQIVGCAGVMREVETVYHSILHNLQTDAKLRQTDIAVLVTDMPKYRAAIEATFERPPKRLQYNLVDFSAAGISVFGQAVLGILDLALESFSRSRVFQVILNPCFLARLAANRAEAMTWLEWAESLGIYQGWDAEEKAHQGYPRSPFYAWRLGLQRLRLGRYMDIEGNEPGEPATRFGHVLPFADLASTDREQLDAFCRAVEGLLPTLAWLRSARLSGKDWRRELERLVNGFLDVPADRPEEAHVLASLYAGLEKLDTWDALHDDAAPAPGLPLALVREYVQSQLEGLEGNRGEYLIGGVTISALQPMRPIPFAIVYVVGLGEDSFPGSNALSSFDLRGVQRNLGDIRPAEQKLYDFLATILSAQKKLYLLYDNHDLQKDQRLLPALPLQQLQRYLTQNVLRTEFEAFDMPTRADGVELLDAASQPAHQDVLAVQRDADRCLAVIAARQEHRLELSPNQEVEWASKQREYRQDFTIPPAAAETPRGSLNVTVTELRRFLHLPAREALRRHLRVEEEDDRLLDDDEPLVTSKLAMGALVRQALSDLVLDAVQTDVPHALAAWPARFAAIYADSRLRSLAPEEAFGEIDQASIVRELQERIHGQGQIETFLRGRAGMTFCGPVLLGESLTPLGAKLRFPALRLRPGQELPADAREIRLLSSTLFAWHAAGRFEILIITNSKVDGREVHASMLEPALFHLALLAGVEPNADGMSSQRWLERREFSLNLAHADGIQTWTYPPDSITGAEATQYLLELTRDFLDPAQFDLLPFDVLTSNKELQMAMHADFATQATPEAFRLLLDEAVADARENTYGYDKIPPIVDMVNARVPADALAKVQRRFRLLDRGPASVRQQPRVSKGKRVAKP